MMEITLSHANLREHLITIMLGTFQHHLESDDPTNHNNPDRFNAHEPFNHEGGNIDHHNTDYHKDGGNGHHSKDDTPFSLPFP